MCIMCVYVHRSGFDPWVRKILWRREQQFTPVFLPGESHGQRSLVGYSPWGCKGSDTTEPLTHTHTCVYMCAHVYTYTYIYIYYCVSVIFSIYVFMQEV